MATTIASQLETHQSAEQRAIAIIGMACRFPGAATIEQFYENLCAGREAITFFSAAELATAGIDPALLANPNYVKAAPVLADFDHFDAGFFHYAQRDAELMDPQHRLFLECAWEALERAGYARAPEEPGRRAIGVFGGAGSLMGTYLLSPSHINQQLIGPIASREHIGNDKDHLCTRVSYKLNLCGPSLTVQTACSTSLVAIHLACQSLLAGECDMALAGGVTVRVPHQAGYLYEKGEVFSPDGHCRAFDAQGEGTLFGSGVGIVVLKPLAQALADGDMIDAVIRSSAINNDGSDKMSYWATNHPGQSEAMQRAFRTAHIEPETIGYVEAHGTATHLGDMIEVFALRKAFATTKQGFCALGSVKTNIGHTDSAAGVAGLIKAVLSLKHKKLLPSLHFTQPNPRIDFANSPFYVNTECKEWVPSATPRRAAVNSLGIGGTNAFVILEEAPLPLTSPPPLEAPFHLLTLSAKSPAALIALADRYVAALAANPAASLAEISYTTHQGRAHFPQRAFCVADSVDSAIQQLSTLELRTSTSTGTGAKGVKHSPPAKPKIAFLFTGQGSQYVGMGRDLYATNATFRAILDRCEPIMQAALGRSLLALLYPEQVTAAASGMADADSHDLLTSHPCGQAVNFALACALIEVWRSWGVTPDVVLGHSLGDFAAAYAAGVLTLEEGLRLVIERGRLMETAVGAMAFVLASEAAVAPYLAGVGDVAIGAVNSPTLVVLSGSHAGVAQVTNQLYAAGFMIQRLPIPVAGHSPLLDPMLDAFEAAVRRVHLTPPTCRVISGMTGQPISRELTDPLYWRQHLRNTVRFADGVATLHRQGVRLFVEIGPQGTLLALAEQCIEQADDASPQQQPVMLPSLRKGQNDWQCMLTSLGELYVRGASIDWAGLDQGKQQSKAPLPTYPFQRQRYWLAPTAAGQAPTPLHPLVDKTMRLPLDNKTVYETAFSVARLPFLAEHRVYDTVVSPGACQLAMVLSAAALGFGAPTPVALHEVILPQALVLSPSGRRMVQTHFAAMPAAEPEQVQQRTFQVISFDAETVSDATQTHATGIVTRPAGMPAPAIDLASLRQQCHRPVSPAAFYAELATAQVDLGDSFRWLTHIWQGQTAEAGTPAALGEVVLPAAVGNVQGYVLHPGLLDACFQVARLAQLHAASVETQLPFAIDTLHQHAAITGARWWCYATQSAPQKWDIQLLDEQGRLLVTLQGYQTRAAAATAVRDRESWQDWRYTVAWQPQALAPVTTALQAVPATAEQTWIIFADQQGVGASLAAHLRASGKTPVLLYADKGPTTEALILPTVTADAYVPLLQKLLAQRPCQGIVHLWSLDTPTARCDAMTGAQTNCGTVLHLVQTLLQSDSLSGGLWLVTQQSQAVTPAETVIGFAQAPLWGLGKVIAVEHPELRSRSLDLGGDASVADWGLQLCHEVLGTVNDTSVETQVALRVSSAQTSRFVARLQCDEPSAVAPPSAQAIRPDATYLVTGGLGGLGLVVARWLAEQGARHLLLLGRSQPKAAAQNALTELAAAGVDLQVIAADVSNAVQLQAVFAAIDPAYPLRGIVHAAGVLDDGALVKQQWQRFAGVLAPKVQGAWHLHTLSQGAPLDFFVLFSSAASLLGTRGQANHAAANAFLDALAHWRQGQGLPALSINWGAWAEVGAAATLVQEQQQSRAAQGIGSIAPDQGIAALAALLGQGAPQVGVLPLTWARYQPAATQPFFAAFRKESSATPPISASEAGSLDQQLLNSPPAERPARLLPELQKITAKILGIPDFRQLDPTVGLLQMGFDSLMAIELRNRLSKRLTQKLPATLVFDYPTLTKIQEFILAGLLPEQSPVTAPELGVKQSKQAETSAVNLDDLSDDELMAQIDAEFMRTR